MANNPLFNALGGGLPAQVPQQVAPSPAPAGALGEGSIFQALAQSPMQQGGAQPLQLGPQVADNSDRMPSSGMQDAMRAAFKTPQQQPVRMQNVGYTPPPQKPQLTDEELMAKFMNPKVK